MVFGLFKKNQAADTIFVNGKLYTQNADMPWAEAIACRDGKIIYVGNNEEAEGLAGADTERVDLDGKYLVPGLISTHSHPAMRVFDGSYLEVPQTYDLEAVMVLMSDYIEENPANEVYFGYGFAPNLLEQLTQEKASELLDGVCKEKPVMLMSHGEQVFWVNNEALDRAREAAQEEGVPMISVDFFMSAVNPFDYDVLQEKVLELAAEYCDRGFTSIVSAGAPEFMDRVYQDLIVAMHQQDMIKQRNFGSLEVSRDMKPETVIKRLMQKRTHTTEMDDLVGCDILKINLSREGENKTLSSESIKSLLAETSERGFHVIVEALDSAAFKECMELMEEARMAGHRKNHLAVACEKEFYSGMSLAQEDLWKDNIFLTPSTKSLDEYAAIEEAVSAEQIIDRFTIDGAIIIGMDEELGTLEIGKQADFAVFEKNPLEANLPSQFKKLQADMTVISGRVIYDAEGENMQEWYDLMSGLQF